MKYFFVGCHHASDVKRFEYACVSVNQLRDRREIHAQNYIIDSGAFQELWIHGRYRHSPGQYAREVRRWKGKGNLMAAVTQDFMCEPAILAKTGLTVADHQRLTIERFDATKRARPGVYLMPVLQGYEPKEYVAHIQAYGKRLKKGMWTGVGSVCKRNSNPRALEEVLLAIYEERPDLRLHGFGVKITALASSVCQALLWSSDSNAWSYAARRQGRNQNDWREGEAFRQRVMGEPVQLHLYLSQVV